MLRTTFLIVAMSLFWVKTQAQQQRYSRFQYHQYHWRAFHTPAFHIYFPEGYDSLCARVASEVITATALVNRRMGTSFQAIPNIILYPAADQLYESNIGSFEPGDKALPTFVAKGNRLLLSYNGNYEQLKEQLIESLVRACWESRLNEGLEAQITGSNQKIPYWISEGSIRYFAHHWTIHAEDVLLNYIREAQPASWDQVISNQQAVAGQAFCYFLSQQYFNGAPKQLFFLLQKQKPLLPALRLVTKTETAELFAACLQFYKERALRENAHQIDSSTASSSYRIVHKKGRILQVLANEQVSFIAYVIATWHKRTIYIYHLGSQKTYFVATYQLPPWINDHGNDAYPLLSWTSGGNELLVTFPERGKLKVNRYYKEGSLISKTILPGLDGAGSVNTHWADEFIISAWRQGQSDIVNYNYNREKYSPYMNDHFDDAQPMWSISLANILFVSKRPLTNDKNDTVSYRGIFRREGKEVVPVIADTTDYAQYSHPQYGLYNGTMIVTNAKGREQFASLSYLTENTKDHLQYGPASISAQYLPRNQQLLKWQSTADSLFIQQHDAKYIFETSYPSISPWLADYHKDAAMRAAEDSILSVAIANNTPSFLDGVFNQADAKAASDRRKDSIRNALKYDPKKSSPYILQLYSAYFTAKVNNDYFINRYQPYESYQGQFRFPQIGGMAQGGFSDLFENHHINLAFRLPAGTDGSDFFIRYKNTAKLVDWELSYYRKAEDLKPDPLRNWVDENGKPYPNTAKVKTNYYELSLDYPLTYFSDVHFTLATRQDKTVFLATEKYSLDFPAFKSLWGMATLSYQYDKLQPTLPLLSRGFIGRLAIDGFKGFTREQKALAGLTMKTAYHFPIYKYITLVAQLQAGYSSGDHRVLYNLGGVDNNITPRTDSNVHFAQDAPYAFQTLVTPFRGYFQNSVYGSSFALLNLDVYFPIFQTLIPVETPLSAINNLQLGLFADIVTAGGKAAYSTKDKGWQSAFGFSTRTTLAGYPLRFDMGWPGSGGTPVWYLSMMKSLN